MKHELVLIHGRAQENLNADTLKLEWIAAWAEGLKLNNLVNPLAHTQIRFPYYGQTLYDLVTGISDDDVADVIVRGDAEDKKREAFMREVLDETRRVAGVSDAEIKAAIDQEFAMRGALNWPWVRGTLKAIDEHIPGASSASIALATHDVYDYLNDPGLRDKIETGVRAAITPEIPTVVVAHSLGTVVAYNLLKREGSALGWKIPLLVTVGSPLAVTAIKRALRPIGFPACVEKWYNAMDVRDIVALYPLDEKHFNVTPAIENNLRIENQTENRHGIAGYLNNREVAKRIYDAVK